MPFQGYAARTIIAVVCFLIFIYALPLLLSVIGVGIAANAFQLIKLCAAVIALGYIVWGTYP